MASSFLGFPTIVRAKIGTVELDASLSEDHQYLAEITENPVEDGTIFSDHVVLQPVVLEMEGRISDATQSLFSFRGAGKSAEAFRLLVSLQKSRETFSVITGLAVYQNMMFQKLSVPRVARDGRSLRFTSILREILIVGDNVETNRDRIADDVKHTAISSVSKGLVTKLVAL